MDMTRTIIPKSDQINADDLIGSSVTVTITGVTEGSAEQPVDIHLAEFPGRAYRPSKSMRRVLVAAWGANTDPYAGRRMTLYRDPDVKFGGDAVGGIKISHLSDIKGRMQIALTEKRGKRAPHVVDPLPDAPAPAPRPTAPSREDIDACTDLATLQDWSETYTGERKAYVEDRIAVLMADPEPALIPDDEETTA